MNDITKGVIILKKDNPVKKYLKIAQDIIVFNSYDNKPYLNTNENLKYIDELVTTDMKRAFTIMSSGDSVIKLIDKGITDVVTADNNIIQLPVFSLKRAAIKGLNANDYESFFIDETGINFFSSKVFESIKDKFLLEETIERDFWQYFLNEMDKNEFKYFRKGGIESLPVDVARDIFPFLKKKRQYIELQDKLNNAKITPLIDDAIEALIKEKENFDYIDITNILLFMNQIKGKDFKEYIKILKKIYEDKLNDNGVFVLDYMFGTTVNKIYNKKEEDNLKKKQIEIYKETYEVLNDLFDISTLNMTRIPCATPLDGMSDTVVYTKKKLRM